MDYKTATAPTATVEKLGVRYAPWQTARVISGNRVEVTTMPVVGLKYWYLRSMFCKLACLQADRTLFNRLWVHDDYRLRRDYGEISRDYCIVVSGDESEILTWVVIIQTAGTQHLLEVRKYSVTCLWPQKVPVGRAREHAIEIAEDMTRSYIDQALVRKSRLPGIPIGNHQYVPAFSPEAPIRFSWPQIDEVH